MGGERPTLVASFRRSRTRWTLVACFGGMFVVALTQVPASAYEDSAWSPNSASGIATRIFCAFLAAWSLLLTIKIARMGIFVDGEGITVRNMFNTRRASWSDVVGFERPASYGALRRVGLKIILRGGSAIFASLYGPGPFSRPTFADETIARLEALRIEHSE